MYNTNITNFRKNLFAIMEETVKYNEPVHITTKDGNAVILSEEDYEGLMETLHITTFPELKQEIVDGLHTSIDECVAEDEVIW